MQAHHTKKFIRVRRLRAKWTCDILAMMQGLITCCPGGPGVPWRPDSPEGP